MNDAFAKSDDLANLMTNRRAVGPGEVIFLEGQDGDAAFIILNGDVQVMVTDAQGNSVVINTMKAGEIFGELALLQDGCKRTATALSKTGCELLVVKKEIFAKHFAGADPFLRYVLDHLCRRIIMWTDRVRTSEYRCHT